MGTNNLAHAAQRKIFSAEINKFIRNLNNNPKARTNSYLRLANVGEKFWGTKGADKEKLERAKKALADPNNRWVKYINKVIDETNPDYLSKMALNLGYEAFFRGTKKIRKNRKKYGCNVPWLILFDPTMACNMHCIGCWSGTYGHKANLTFEDMDKIVTEGKELGVYLYMMTGGEPMVRKADIIKLCEKHNDCFFAAYSNSTLIDEELCKKVVELGNLTFMLSIEGTPETNDARRGDGHYEAVMKAMDLLKKYGIIYGTSICYTRDNIEAVTSDEFLRFISEKGARFGFYFHYMPVGNNAVPELMPTVEQRKNMIERIRFVRSNESDIEFFPMDFQNDGEYVGGCIAGGRNYFHINSNGDAEPCVFIHFSDSNIHEKSILEILQSPLFMAYHDGQPFNKNHLRPCPMLENPEKLRGIVAATGAKQTNMESPESVDHLCSKADTYARDWGKAADEIWESQHSVQTHKHSVKAPSRHIKHTS
ncbi:radical SAM protein [Pseudobutyrivibrio ruminis]|uniref:Pyrroloquinoline quinone biosynthesis protein PqqE n=1 Tax=Pseudobutyrivibrio ruminis TaxID=46206 RepID=A0A2G3DST3_9FIRM|nr:radical SAM protein [Pseudobutyrivibrio ruminis]PHU33925.1 pyrroloquinoline quinone biosynthesis protein PqqE [Pseudobutyrivibrio ruminis]